MEFACTLAVLLAVAHATPVAPTVPENLNDPQVWKSFGDSYYHFGSATTGTFDAAGEFLKFRNVFMMVSIRHKLFKFDAGTISVNFQNFCEPTVHKNFIMLTNLNSSHDGYFISRDW